MDIIEKNIVNLLNEHNLTFTIRKPTWREICIDHKDLEIYIFDHNGPKDIGSLSYWVVISNSDNNFVFEDTIPHDNVSNYNYMFIIDALNNPIELEYSYCKTLEEVERDASLVEFTNKMEQIWNKS